MSMVQSAIQEKLYKVSIKVHVPLSCLYKRYPKCKKIRFYKLFITFSIKHNQVFELAIIAHYNLYIY